jgi:hypothetical protein
MLFYIYLLHLFLYLTCLNHFLKKLKIGQVKNGCEGFIAHLHKRPSFISILHPVLSVPIRARVSPAESWQEAKSERWVALLLVTGGRARGGNPKGWGSPPQSSPSTRTSSA